MNIQAIEPVTRIISEGGAGGPLPGVIAPTRFDAFCVGPCRNLTQTVSEPMRIDGTPSTAFHPDSPLDRPPMVILSPDPDPNTLARAPTCRDHRARDAPIHPETLPPVPRRIGSNAAN